MKPNKKKKIYIIAAVVAISVLVLGVLAYLFLKKENDSDSNKSTVIERSSKSAEEEGQEAPGEKTKDIAATQKFAEACLKYEKLCFKYPADWKVNLGEDVYPARNSPMAEGMREDEFVAIDAVSVESPSGSIKMFAKSGVTGIGGACIEEYQGYYTTLKWRSTKIPIVADELNSKADNVYVASMIESNHERTKFTPTLYLHSSDANKRKGERGMCSGGMYSMVVDGRNVDMQAVGNTPPHHIGALIFGLGGMGSFGSEGVESYASFEEAKNFTETKEYKQAFDILSSAHYK